MIVRYDKEVDAAYIYLEGETADGEAVRTCECELGAGNGMINLDFDREGKLLGLELIPASQFLSAKFLAEAE